MYIPKPFEVSEDTGREIMLAHSWALLVTTGAEGVPFASHLALLWQDDGSPHGHLIGHMARANDHWKLFERAPESMAMFWGPHAYVSPTWYAPGPKVPTWNYVTVHAYGRPEIIDDTKGVLDVLAKLAAVYEGNGPEAWTLDRLPPGNAEAQIRGIVAFRMPITRIEPKAKLSQNRDLEDRHRVIAKFEASDSQDAQAVALWMKKALP
ncbi:MAG: FMN-binding negative transcriptional regulator [Alphaproteobacteria bacterium]|jgi:transcriptional regulator|nr:FMN-binding negative transcriptional regulator [Alphaproteobacteria bacterium]